MSWVATPSHKSWSNMLQRCTNANNPAFKDYGARGITVCARWRSFANFLADMGERPAGLTLERIDNNGNYEPGNCRWATRADQNRNQRCNRMLTHNGETLRIGQWADRLGMRETKIRWRLNRGWSVELAVTTPSSKRNSVTRSTKGTGDGTGRNKK